MFTRKVKGRAIGLVIGDEVDATLSPQIDIFGAMLGDTIKTHHFKDWLQRPSLRRRKFDKFKAVALRYNHFIGCDNN